MRDHPGVAKESELARAVRRLHARTAVELIVRRNGFARSTAEGDKDGSGVRWIRTYVVPEQSGELGTFCIYEAESPEAIHAHARAAALCGRRRRKLGSSSVAFEVRSLAQSGPRGTVVIVAVLTLVLAACGAASETQGDAAAAGGEAVERCADRFIQRASEESGDAGGDEVRRYVTRTYCEPFARRGWVYDDGTLKIAVQQWLVDSGACEIDRPSGSTQRVPCTDTDGGVIDCALLHHVRRPEVQDYLRTLRQDGAIECDDGTPLGRLGTR